MTERKRNRESLPIGVLSKEHDIEKKKTSFSMLHNRGNEEGKERNRSYLPIERSLYNTNTPKAKKKGVTPIQ